MNIVSTYLQVFFVSGFEAGIKLTCFMRTDNKLTCIRCAVNYAFCRREPRAVDMFCELLYNAWRNIVCRHINYKRKSIWKVYMSLYKQ